MAGDAYDTIKRFWEIQDGGDYSLLSALFTEDAVLVDPIFGTFVGGEAISGFMAKMNVEMKKAGATFFLEELSGDGETAWARWRADTSKGPRNGVGIYRVRDGKLTYYRDYMNELGH
jgi:steroid Delta-isomerase